MNGGLGQWVPRIESGVVQPNKRGSFKAPPPMHWGVMEQIKADEKVGRNDPCPCESGRKFKRCCLP